MRLLRLFGGFRIDGGEALTRRAAQRKRLAILALLGAAPARALSRDKVIALLWPETDTERGRHLLASSVYELRKALGEDAILSLGDDLRLNPERVGSNVWEFEEALARGERARAAELYAGPLLDGFFVAGAPEFERWVEAERERLARACTQALETLAEEWEARGDLPGAVEWWRRLAAGDPYSSRIALRLMRALAAAGDPAGAVQHARVHEALLREEMEIEPDGEVVALAERLRDLRAERSGTGAARPEVRAPVVEERSVTAPQADAPPRSPGAPSPRLSRVRRRPRTFGVAAVSAALVIAAGVWGSGGGAWTPPTETAAIRSLAVLPLRNDSNDSTQAYFVDGMTDALITELSQLGQLRVISRTSVMRYRDAVQRQDPGRQRLLGEIARELKVDAVVEGSVLRDSGEVRISVRLIHAATEGPLWARSYTRDLRDVLSLQGEIAQAVAQAVRLRVAPGGAASPVDPRAYALHLRALHLWNEDQAGNHREAIEYFSRALAIEPDFAPAHAGLADIYVHLDEWRRHPNEGARGRALEAVRRALALDETLAEAHSSLAHLLMHQEEWRAAEMEYRRAIELNPNYAYARLLYAFQLVALERPDEAVREARRALELDPLHERTNGFAAHTFYFAHRYDEAIAQWRHTIDLYPRAIGAYFGIARAYVEKGMPSEAVEWAERGAAIANDPGARLGLAQVYAATGRGDEARRIVEELESRFRAEELDALAMGRVYAHLQETDRAFAWLARAVEGEHGWAMFFRVEPAYAPLRGDPRFDALLERMRLE